MNDTHRTLVLLHGAATVLIALVLGLAAVYEEVTGSEPLMWRAAHNAIFLAGVWLLAMAAVWNQLDLTAARSRALCYTLLLTIYAFATAVLVQAATGVRAIEPSGSFTTLLAFGANVVTVGAGFFAGLITVAAALSALRRGDTA